MSVQMSVQDHCACGAALLEPNLPTSQAIMKQVNGIGGAVTAAAAMLAVLNKAAAVAVGGPITRQHHQQCEC